MRNEISIIKINWLDANESPPRTGPIANAALIFELCLISCTIHVRECAERADERGKTSSNCACANVQRRRERLIIKALRLSADLIDRAASMKRGRIEKAGMGT